MIQILSLIPHFMQLQVGFAYHHQLGMNPALKSSTFHQFKHANNLNHEKN